MSFSDIIKKSVLESFSSADMSAKYVSVVLIETFLIALYIFMVYRFITRSSFYNKNYAISMAIISEITAGIILAMQSNLDLLFLFWSIGTGIICGAGLFSRGVLIAVFVTIGIVLLNLVPAFSAPQLLILKLNDSAAEKQALDVVKKNASSFKVDSKSATSSAVTLIIEVKTKSGSDMVNELVSLGSVISATLMEHEGEVKN